MQIYIALIMARSGAYLIDIPSDTTKRILTSIARLLPGSIHNDEYA